MKLVKSGIEMDPPELDRFKGGKPCACGCPVMVHGDGLHGGASLQGLCECICEGTGTSEANIGDFADSQI